MTNHDTLLMFLMWHQLFEEAQKIEEYDDLTAEFNSLIATAWRKEISEEDNLEFYRIIKTYWKRIISDGCQRLKDNVEKRKNKGETFSGILSKINKIRNRGERDLDIDEYSDIFDELKEINCEVEEKLSIEKYQKNRFLIGLIVGFLLGILANKIGGWF